MTSDGDRVLELEERNRRLEVQIADLSLRRNEAVMALMAVVQQIDEGEPLIAAVTGRQAIHSLR
jgi:hypothetical protein